MRRTTLVGAVLVVVIDVILIAVAVTTYFGGATSMTTLPLRHRGATSATTLATHATHKDSTTSTTSTTSTSSTVSRSTYHPLRVVPPQTAVQQAVDQALVQSSTQGAKSLLERAAFPAPATSTAFPRIDATVSSSAPLYAMAFTQELLDVDFATSTRHELLAWADYNDAPYSLGDLPPSLATRVLATSLTSGTSPVPSATKWAQLAAERTSWSVNGLVVSVSPVWTQAVSAGWEPVDPLMGIYDVSGTLTTTWPGHLAIVTSISFALTLGGASSHPGYGAVALDDWTVN